MDKLKIAHLISEAEDLQATRRKILDLDPGNNFELVKNLISDFYRRIREIKNRFIDYSAIPLDPKAHNINQETLSFIQDIFNGKKFDKIEKKKGELAFRHLIKNTRFPLVNFKKYTMEELYDNALRQSDDATIEELYAILNIGQEVDIKEDQKLAEEHYFVWFSQYEFIQGMRDAGAIILKSNKLPEYFNEITDTIKKCYAFDQYLAVIVLCRTALEIAVRDIYKKLGFNKPKTDAYREKKQFFYEMKSDKTRTYINEFDPPFWCMKILICNRPGFEDFKKDLENIYGAISRIIHGSPAYNSPSTISYLEDTFGLIHDLYAKLNN